MQSVGRVQSRTQLRVRRRAFRRTRARESQRYFRDVLFGSRGVHHRHRLRARHQRGRLEGVIHAGHARGRGGTARLEMADQFDPARTLHLESHQIQRRQVRLEALATFRSPRDRRLLGRDVVLERDRLLLDRQRGALRVQAKVRRGNCVAFVVRTLQQLHAFGARLGRVGAAVQDPEFAAALRRVLTGRFEPFRGERSVLPDFDPFHVEAAEQSLRPAVALLRGESQSLDWIAGARRNRRIRIGQHSRCDLERGLCFPVGDLDVPIERLARRLRYARAPFIHRAKPNRGDRVPGAHRSLVQGERRGRVLSHPVTLSVGVAQQSKQARICVRCRLDLRQRPECLRVESPLVERHHRVVVRRRCPCRAPERE